MPLKIDYTGKKHGYLTLLVKSKAGSKGVGSTWLALCDCGNRAEVIAKDVTRGRIKSCGKCHLKHRPIGRTVVRSVLRKSALQRAYIRIMKEALRRGLAYSLPLDKYAELLNESCTYCGKEPSQRITINSNLRHLPTRVDILKPAEGYTPENCVPCCHTCGDLKRDRNYLEFLEQVMRIGHHIQKKIESNQIPVDNK